MYLIDEIDRNGDTCLVCHQGVYMEKTLYDSWDGILTCTNCDDTIERYQETRVPLMP